MQILPQSNFRIYTSPQTFKRRRLCKGINRRKRELLGVTLGSIWGFPDGLDCKESACNVEDLGSIPGSGRYLGGGNCYSFQYSCLENSMDRGVWQATVHGVPKRRKWLSVCARAHTHTHTHTHTHIMANTLPNTRSCQQNTSQKCLWWPKDYGDGWKVIFYDTQEAEPGPIDRSSNVMDFGSTN